jgi:hypothetical protein
MQISVSGVWVLWGFFFAGMVAGAVFVLVLIRWRH